MLVKYIYNVETSSCRQPFRNETHEKGLKNKMHQVLNVRKILTLPLSLSELVNEPQLKRQ